MNWCIYCQTTDAPFTAREHIFPQSLGNDELVLPAGYVCDPCNHGVLSVLDQALQNFELIAFMCVWHVPATKKGKAPWARFGDTRVTVDHHRFFRIQTERPLDSWVTVQDQGDGTVKVTVTLHPTRRQSRIRPVARALYKVALGMLALTEGHAGACSARYDLARHFILGRSPGFPNNLVRRLPWEPRPVLGARRLPEEGTIFLIVIYGLVFCVNLEAQPILVVDDPPGPELADVIPLS